MKNSIVGCICLEIMAKMSEGKAFLFLVRIPRIHSLPFSTLLSASRAHSAGTPSKGCFTTPWAHNWAHLMTTAIWDQRDRVGYSQGTFVSGSFLEVSPSIGRTPQKKAKTCPGVSPSQFSPFCFLYIHN